MSLLKTTDVNQQQLTQTELKETVLEALHEAFDPAKIDPAYLDVFESDVAGLRILGSVTITESAKFDQLDDIRRQRELWKRLRAKLGADAIRVGPIILEPTNLV